MPRPADRLTADHRLWCRSLPGLYRWLHDRAVRRADGIDPRGAIGGYGFDDRPRHMKTYLPVQELERGEPAVIPAWLLGGNSWPEARDWPSARDRSVTQYRVYADDRVEALRG
ncbi:MAG: hypothetical protein K0U84_21840 [Actinomycetia bacterium]|nr:hypothetical protein [Actinomycetes bacterium]